MPSLLCVFDRLSLTVLERGWLSSNNVVFRGGRDGAAVVDTGYSSHAAQTVALVAARLGPEPLERVVNTHLHSDHCGGNAALHQRWHCKVTVPRGDFEAASTWDDKLLTFSSTGQRCDQFPVNDALRPGTTLLLGPRQWEIHSAPGHDPNAVMLFEPAEKVLISGDALWRHGVSIIFPEFVGGDGFASATRALDAIEKLAPRVVIPGHGPPFTELNEAIAQSRARLEAYTVNPAKHRDYSGRALFMFHMLEHRRRKRDEAVAWAASTSVFQSLAPAAECRHWIDGLVDRLIATGALKASGKDVYLS